MAYQDPEFLALDGLSLLDDPRPSTLQPVLSEDIHLRWAFGPRRAFPLHGYHLFRRGYGDPAQRCLGAFLGALPVGPVPEGRLETPYGRLSASPATLTTIDELEPRGSAEISLEGQEALRFDLPPGVSAWRVTTRIGFLPRPEPEVRRTEVDFRRQPEGTGPNPRTEQGVLFEVFRSPGVRLPATRIRTAVNGGGIECNQQLVIALPQPAFMGSMILNRRQQDPPIVVRSFNQDGSLAEERQFGGAPVVISYAFSGAAIVRIVIDAPGENTLLHYLSLQSRAALPEILIRVLRGNRRAAELPAPGAPGEIVLSTLQADGITAVVISGGPAALIDLCYWVRGSAGLPAAQPGPWTQVPGFPYPLTLPITHPFYPASQGAEALSVRRPGAEQRIRYGTAAEALPAQPRQPGTGTLTLSSGSALVKGRGTAWDESLVGTMIFPSSEDADTAYTVMAVLAPDRLVLSRTHSGPPLADIHYEVTAEDAFAQIHDQIGAVLDQPLAMHAATIPPVLESSAGGRRAVLQNDSRLVKGQATSWSRDLEGLLLEVGPSPDVYRIDKVDPARQEITLHVPYVGPGGPAEYRILSRSPHNRIEEGPSLGFRPLDLLEMASLSPAYAQLLGLYWIDASAERGATYDYILLADHGSRFGRDGAVALRWLNGSPDWEAETGVDGALLAGIRHTGSGALPAPSALQVFALSVGRTRQTPERPDLADTEPGLSILDLKTWPALPPAQRPLLLDVWRAAHGPQTPPSSPPGPQAYQRLGSFAPSPRDPGDPSPRPPGWPDPASIHFIDGGPGGLDVGWYSYRVSAVDLYGRYSALSPPIPWHDAAGTQRHPYAVHLEDRTPPPPPTDVMAWVLEPETIQDPTRVEDDAYKAWRAQVGPGTRGLRLRWLWSWSHVLTAPDLEEFRIYAQSKPLNARFHHIVAVTPSPDPSRSDLTLAAADAEADDAYKGATLQVGHRGFAVEASRGGAALRLRVKNGGPRGTEPPAAGRDATIVLPAGHALHRDLLAPLNWERWIGAVPHKAPAHVRYTVETLEDPTVITVDSEQNGFQGDRARWDGTYVVIENLAENLRLQSIRPGFDVLSLTSDSPPVHHVLEIQSVDPARLRILPAAPLPSGLATGQRYHWAVGPAEPLLRGLGATWNATTRTLSLAPHPDLSRVRPGIDLVYVKATPASTPESLEHFFGIEKVDAKQYTLILSPDGGKLGALTPGKSYEWRIGWPLRVYEVFLPAQKAGDADDPFRQPWLEPSLAEPVAYATVSVSAADWRKEVPDSRPGRARPGNEGALAAPATIFRVHREIPEAPADVQWTVERLWATRADYYGRSYFTVRWPKPSVKALPYTKALVFRALDETLFRVDWEQHRQPLSATNPPTDPRPAHWSPARKAGVAAELAGPNSKYEKIRATKTFAEAQPLYRSLSDDALSVLANLPGNDDAFAQISIQALDHMDPANDDRRGPDDDVKIFPGANPALSAWLDTLDGRSQNRYLYKVAYLDSANNRGPLSKAGPPVYLHKVVPPREPVITKVLGGDRQITLKWAANREPDLAGYRVYRTEDKEKARDVRLMELVGTVGPSEVEFQDAVPGLVAFYYRLTAVDTAGNESGSTREAAGRAFDLTPP